MSIDIFIVGRTRVSYIELLQLISSGRKHEATTSDADRPSITQVILCGFGTRIVDAVSARSSCDSISSRKLISDGLATLSVWLFPTVTPALIQTTHANRSQSQGSPQGLLRKLTCFYFSTTVFRTIRSMQSCSVGCDKSYTF